MLEIDIEAIRADTPACRDRIHFNNAGASLMPTPVYKKLTEYLALEQRVGPYEAAENRQEDFEGFYRVFAKLLNALPEEIAYAENASRAWATAMSSIPFRKGDQILVHETEYASNYLMLLRLAQLKGLIIDLIPSDALGQIDIDGLRQKITSRTRVVAVTHIAAQGGGINPVVEIGKICREHNPIYVLDACQSIGQMPINVKNIHCDILVGTGRKYLRGPRGTGFLYVSNRILADLVPGFIELHTAHWKTASSYEIKSTVRRFESWERYMAGQLGLAAAVEYAADIGFDAIWTRIQTLSDYLQRNLAGISGVTINGSGVTQCGIVAFSKAGKNAGEIVHALRHKNINTSALALEQAKLDFERKDISSLLRCSLHYFNTTEEIDYFCDAISNI